MITIKLPYKTINNWLRNKFINNKRCNLYNIKHQEIVAAYSSLIGNTLFRKECLPNMILASLEISRRAYLYKLIYIDKTIKKQGVIFPNKILFQKTINLLKSLEEFKLNYSKINTWKDLYQSIKNSKMMYRVSLLKNKPNKVFKLSSYKSLVLIHSYKKNIN